MCARRRVMRSDVDLADGWLCVPLQGAFSLFWDLHRDTLSPSEQAHMVSSHWAMGVSMLSGYSGCRKGQGWQHKPPSYTGPGPFSLPGLALATERQGFAQEILRVSSLHCAQEGWVHCQEVLCLGLCQEHLQLVQAQSWGGKTCRKVTISVQFLGSRARYWGELELC